MNRLGSRSKVLWLIEIEDMVSEMTMVTRQILWKEDEMLL